jgi:hypothetical protein
VKIFGTLDMEPNNYHDKKNAGVVNTRAGPGPGPTFQQGGGHGTPPRGLEVYPHQTA